MVGEPNSIRAFLVRRCGIEFCVPFAEVAEVGRIFDDDPHPHELERTLVLHGRALRVIDPAASLAKAEDSPKNFLALVAVADVCLGVDEIVGLVETETSEPEPGQDEPAGEEKDGSEGEGINTHVRCQRPGHYLCQVSQACFANAVLHMLHPGINTA